ncbi:MAG: aquaporin, partial [Pseudomonadota bacterium]|nr:aquaporin [Pseudomonadota bacterium]
GAHFNPAVTIAFLVEGEISARDAAISIVVQVLGALVGMLVAHGMFDLALIQESTKVRTGIGQWFAEGVATFGLVATIFGCIRARPGAVAMAVGLYITAGYWFTASTSFANPAVTIARSFTDTFSGIQPANAPAFIGMQIVGAILAVLVIGWLWRDAADD